MASRLLRAHRRLAAGAALVVALAVAGAWLAWSPRPLPGDSSLVGDVGSGSGRSGIPSVLTAPSGSAPPSSGMPSSAGPSPSASVSASLAPGAVSGAGPSAFPFDPIDLLAPSADPSPAGTPQPGDPTFFRYDPRRPVPTQSPDWLALKATGRIAVSGGRIVTLPADADPLANPATGAAVPQAAALDLRWTRWIVEPPGVGVDERGNRYTDQSYWNLCGPGATAVALYYWQQLTGAPNVTGTAGYFLDPYAAAGVAWPASGPRFTTPDGVSQRYGTYWSGSDRLNGFTAHGRGFVMYLAMAVRPEGWTATGMDTFSGADGSSFYPTRGSSRNAIMAALNWEVAGHSAGWADAYYANVGRRDPNLARDLQTAVMLDVGRDRVGVVAAIDTFDLPNWQAARGGVTPHTRHAIAIVGYDNTTSPPTFTYIDTCGTSSNPRPGNGNGTPHVIPQQQLVQAIQDEAGSGFVW